MSAIADAHWAMDFGWSPDELRPASARVQSHRAGLAGTSGTWILVAGGAPCISMPPDVFASFGERALSWTREQVAESSWLLQQLSELPPGRVGAVIGPAFISYGAAHELDLRRATSAVELHDSALVAELKAACTPEEWAHGGSEPTDETACFGAWSAGGELAALAGYEVWSGSIAHIAIVSRPAARGHGYGTAAVARAARHALAAGLLPQYRTLASNGPSMAIANRLGFRAYGFSMYVRMQPAPP